MARLSAHVIALALFAVPAIAEPASPGCSLKLQAALDLEMDDTGRVTVPVTFNGIEKRLMVDTGATQSFITARAVADMKLKTRSSNLYMEGFGGDLQNTVVDIAEFGFGRLRGNNFTFYVERDWLDSSGLFGANFLYFYDLDFDFAKAKLNLMSPDHCPGQVVYWTSGAVGVIPFTISDNHIVVDMELDGKPVTAILDTGAVDTVMSLERAAFRYSLDWRKLLKSRHYPFKTLTFGGVNITNPTISLVPDSESALMGHERGDQHMIIGMSVLRRLHLYISYKEEKIYVTPATQY